MNPLCCIAPVSIEKDRATPLAAKSGGQYQLGLDSSAKTLKPCPSAQVSSAGTESDRVSASAASAAAASANHDGEDAIADSMVYSAGGSSNGGCCGGSVAGILYKWVNYGKGWRGRWFVLEDGVLSYYKIHGPDKILTSPAREKGVRVIGEDSIRYMRKANWSSSSSNRFGSSAKQCKPFGEVHLKVRLLFFIFNKII